MALTSRPLLSRPIRKPRTPHEYPIPVFEKFNLKPPGSLFDFLNLHAIPNPLQISVAAGS
jgi:hypothetical protein